MFLDNRILIEIIQPEPHWNKVSTSVSYKPEAQEYGDCNNECHQGESISGEVDCCSDLDAGLELRLHTDLLHVVTRRVVSDVSPHAVPGTPSGSVVCNTDNIEHAGSGRGLHKMQPYY